MKKIAQTFKKIWFFLKNHKKKSIFFLLIIGVVSYFVFFRGPGELTELAKAEMGDVIQEVSVTGRVKAAESVDLAFERSGKISSINVKVGDRIYSGQALIRLDSGEILAQRSRELANVESAKQRLEQLIRGDDFKSDKDVARIAVETAINGLVSATDTQIAYFKIIESDRINALKEDAIVALYGDYPGGLDQSPYFFINLNTGLKAKINSLDDSQIDYLSLLQEIEKALLASNKPLEFMRSKLLMINNNSEAGANLNSAINKNLTQLSAITAQQRSIIGGDFDINIAKSQLAQAEASLALIDAQVAKYSIYAPFSGVITSVSAERGEIINPGSPVISMIGNGNLEIEAQISEADVAKIKIGNEVNVTLDAYGSDENFIAKLVHIDPAAKVLDGVATYSATFQFVEQNEKILPGLTADLDIKTDQRKNVLFIPSRDVIYKNDKKYVKVMVKDNSQEYANLTAISESDEGKVFEVEIETGLKGSDGRIEIISGLKEGDQVVKE